MAAGLGFKDFTTGEVLTAADVDGYLMQGVWVFASAAARDAAVTSPQEGNFAYLKDTNVTTYYTGSAWANLDTTGMTNPMTTTGDTIYSSSGSTPARLAIGSTGNVLTVAGGVPTWAAPAGGGANWSLFSSATLTGAATITISGISGADKIFLMIQNGSADALSVYSVRLNGDSAGNYSYFGSQMEFTTTYGAGNFTKLVSVGAGEIPILRISNTSSSNSGGYIRLDGCNASGVKTFISSGIGAPVSSNHQQQYRNLGGVYTGTSTISSISLISSVGNFDDGTVYVYTSA
jgi:hypothetical protein